MKSVELYAEDAYIIEENLYCISSDVALLYTISSNNKASIVGFIPEEQVFIKQSFRRILFWNDELIFIPYNARHVHLYNVAKKTWRKSDCLNQLYNQCMYLEALIYNDRLLMIGADEANIVEMNLDDLSFKIVNRCFEKYKINGEMICRGGHSIVNDVLYLPIATKNVVVGINLEDWTDKEYVIGDDAYGFSGILKCDNFFWLAPRKEGKVLKWDGNNRVCNVEIPFKLDKDKYYFGGLCLNDKCIYIYGLEGKFTVKINTVDGSVEYYEKQYIFMKSLSDNTLIGQLLNGTIEIIKKDEYRQLMGEVDKYELSKIYDSTECNCMVDGDLLLKENDFYNLYDYICCI